MEDIVKQKLRKQKYISKIVFFIIIVLCIVAAMQRSNMLYVIFSFLFVFPMMGFISEIDIVPGRGELKSYFIGVFSTLPVLSFMYGIVDANMVRNNISYYCIGKLVDEDHDDSCKYKLLGSFDDYYVVSKIDNSYVSVFKKDSASYFIKKIAVDDEILRLKGMLDVLDNKPAERKSESHS